MVFGTSISTHPGNGMPGFTPDGGTQKVVAVEISERVSKGKIIQHRPKLIERARKGNGEVSS